MIAGYLIASALDEITRLPTVVSKTKKKPLALRNALATTLILAILTTTFLTFEPQPKRALRLAWLGIVRVIPEEQDAGFLVIGKGMDALAQYHPGPFLFDTSMLYENSQVRLAGWLKSRKIRHILIDNEFIQEEWDKWIAGGNDVKKINDSIFSRAVIYKGRAVKTATLHLPPIVDFEIRDPEVKDFTWLELKPGR